MCPRVTKPPLPLKAGTCINFLRGFILCSLLFLPSMLLLCSEPCLVWMLLLQLLLRLENLMTALLMMPGLQKLIHGNPM